jgi:hypothetical protein
MRGAIDTMHGSISSGTVHSRIGACDPRGLFAKRVLNGDSHHALAITSLRSLIQGNKIYKCATGFHFRVPRNLGTLGATHCVKSALVVSLTSEKDGEIVRHCRQPCRLWTRAQVLSVGIFICFRSCGVLQSLRARASLWDSEPRRI